MGTVRHSGGEFADLEPADQEPHDERDADDEPTCRFRCSRSSASVTLSPGEIGTIIATTSSSPGPCRDLVATVVFDTAGSQGRKPYPITIVARRDRRSGPVGLSTLIVCPVRAHARDTRSDGRRENST
jgi:hypothetical protein